MLKFLPALLAFFVLLFSVQPVFAANLNIVSIGGVETGGTVPTSWTHEGTNPPFIGTASPSASIQVSIDGLIYTAAASSTGAWLYTPVSLTTSGAHEVVISSGTENLIFTLTIAGVGVGGASSTVSASTTTSTTSAQPSMPSELPSTGAPSLFWLSISGLFLSGIGVVGYTKLHAYLEQDI